MISDVVLLNKNASNHVLKKVSNVNNFLTMNTLLIIKVKNVLLSVIINVMMKHQ